MTFSGLLLAAVASVSDTCAVYVSYIVEFFCEDRNEAVAEAVGVLLPLLASVYNERSVEMTSIAVNICSIFQNHKFEVVKAHMKAQDPIYVEKWNRDHEADVALVPLRENADFARASFFGFNGLALRTDGSDTPAVVVEGSMFGRSDVITCGRGYAVGYYSYITEEKMELFFPIDVAYELSME